MANQTIAATEMARITDNGTTVDARTNYISIPMLNSADAQRDWAMVRFGPFSAAQVLQTGSLTITVENTVVLLATDSPITVKLEWSPTVGALSTLETGTGNIDTGEHGELTTRLTGLSTVATITLGTGSVTAGTSFTSTAFDTTDLENNFQWALNRRNGAAWDGNVNVLLIPPYRATGVPTVSWDLAGTTSSNGATAAPSLTLTGLDTPTSKQVTGIVGPWQAQSRVDECPKCGSLSLRETWVRDGWTKHLVCPECWDPPDPQDSTLIIRPETHGLNEET